MQNAHELFAKHSLGKAEVQSNKNVKASYI